MRLLLAALAAVRLLAAGDPALDLLPANTKVVFGMRVAAIVQSPLFNDAGEDARKLSEQWLKVAAITGFDPLHDIDEVLIGTSADNEKAPALLVVRGRFDLERMGAGAARYRGVALLGQARGASGVLALLDASTALAGDAAAVRAAIDRRGQGAARQGVPLGAALAERVQSLRDQFDLWGIGERPEGFVPPTGKNEGLDSMDRFELGIRISKGFELNAEMHARSAKDGTVRLSLAISEEALKKAIAEQRAAASAPKAAPAFTLTPPTTPAPTPAPAAGPPVITFTDASGPAPENKGGTNVFVLPGKK